MQTPAKENSSEQGVVVVERQGAVAIVWLNRPEAFNALNLAVITELKQALESIDADDSVQAVVLSGRGRAFSAGVDLVQITETPGFFDQGGLGPESPVMSIFANCKKPLIAAVNGVAVTGGFELALACDFIYAAESARFADTHAFVGILPGWGLSQKLQRLVGANRAREISFTGDYFSAAEGERWGLVNRVLPDEELMPAAIAAAGRIAEAMPDALQKIKAMINDGGEMNLGDALKMEGERSGEFAAQIDYASMDGRLAALKERARKNR